MRGIVPAALLLVAFPGRAGAGAPNYECRAGSYEIGIDQHRRAGLIRAGGASVQPMPFVQSDQNGPSLDLIATVGGRKSRVTVRGTGSRMTLTTGGRSVTGACVFVPGNFALGYVSASNLVVRTTPADDATVVTVGRKESLVWSPGRFNQASRQYEGTDDWTRVRVVLLVRGGSRRGGEQALGMGDASGLDGRSLVVEGWARVEGLSMLGPAEP